MPFESFLPYKLNGKDLHQLIIGGVTPRPIALVSSISKNGIANLAPYSFFNAISSKPPVLALIPLFGVVKVNLQETTSTSQIPLKAMPLTLFML